MSARRFLLRWNLRILRREWRQHAVIFGLIVAGVALSGLGSLAAYHLTEPPQNEFGNGEFVATSSEPGRLEQQLDDQGVAFGTMQSTTAAISGTTSRVELRLMDPTNPVTHPLLESTAGMWPRSDDEVAVTDRAAPDAPIGSSLVIDGRTVTVVGFVENPTDLSDEFVLVHSFRAFPDAAEVATVEFFVAADETSVDFSGVADTGISQTDGPTARTATTIVVNVIGAFGMLEVALLVGAGFAVIARRRRRQFGLLAAVGATPKMVRSAAGSTGLVLGLAGAVTGTLIAIAAAAIVLPSMETAVGHRIDFSVPWWGVLPNAALAVLVARAAAVWPTRALSDEPVVRLLGAHRPRPEPVGRAALIGVGLTVFGASALAVGFARLHTMLAVAGVLVAPIGLLLAAPLLVSVVGRLATHLHLAQRLAGRTIARNNRRSASIVAALALALAVPTGIAVVTTSLDQRDAEAGTNLAENWFIAWVPGAEDISPRVPAAARTNDVASPAEDLAAAMPELELHPIDVAVLREMAPEPWEFDSIGSALAVESLAAARLGNTECAFCDIESYGFGGGVDYIVTDAWIATPELLSTLEIDDFVSDGSARAVAQADGYRVASLDGILVDTPDVAVADRWPRHTAVPKVLYSPEVAGSDRYDIVRIGWFGTSSDVLTPQDRTRIVDVLGSELLAEFHQPLEPASGLRRVGLLAGLATGLAITMSAIALLASEMAADIRVLASIGAEAATLRRLTAATAGLLALVGALVATLIGFLPILPMLTAREADLPFVVPLTTVGGIVVLFPLLAAATGFVVGSAPKDVAGLRDSG